MSKYHSNYDNDGINIYSMSTYLSEMEKDGYDIDDLKFDIRRKFEDFIDDVFDGIETIDDLRQYKGEFLTDRNFYIQIEDNEYAWFANQRYE